jgi:hypothetical protein
MATNPAPKLNPLKHTFSAPIPKGDQFEVLVTDENGGEVLRKDGFASKEEARQWSRDTVANALKGDAEATPASNKLTGNSNMSL